MKRMTIDNAHSEIGFKVKHLMISTVKGNFSTFSGGIQEDGTVFVSMNVNSINTGNADRDGHLKSADFFNLSPKDVKPALIESFIVFSIFLDASAPDLTSFNKGLTSEEPPFNSFALAANAGSPPLTPLNLLTDFPAPNDSW